MSVGSKIRDRRKEMHMTSASLANEIGVDQSMIIRYENGQVRRIPSNQLEKISKVLKCSVSDLTEGDLNYPGASKKKVSSKMFSEEEQTLIYRYRELPAQAKSVIKEICGWHISLDD